MRQRYRYAAQSSADFPRRRLVDDIGVGICVISPDDPNHGVNFRDFGMPCKLG
eukprot:m.407318 g.407318  ORF g.407318 m.407318 type:complete len:53 (-) comp16797_c0_seq20:101-259(-)